MTDGLGNHSSEDRRDATGDVPSSIDASRRTPPSRERDLDDAAALVLGALSGAEYDTAMTRMEEDAAFRREVAELNTVVGMLPGLLTLPDADRLPSATGAAGGDMAPSAALRGRILDSVLADAPRSSVGASDRSAAGQPAARRTPPRAEGPGTARSSGTSPNTIPASRPSRGNTTSVGQGIIDPRRGANLWLTGLMAVALVVFAVAAVALQVRNSALQEDVEELRAQVITLDQQTVALQQEVQLANAQSNASAWVLNPDPGAGDIVPPEASGTVFYSYREQSVVGEIRGLRPLPENGVYQLWYLGGAPGEEAPRSAGLLEFTEDGTAIFTADSVAQQFDAVAISAEPAGGSETPTTVVMIGTLSAAG
ncbi:MAG TPA: anti-sigma factor [Thermomicrobiales bacterium]|nr:anti-sigma factor [Thermomicrobiales bacterium]